MRSCESITRGEVTGVPAGYLTARSRPYSSRLNFLISPGRRPRRVAPISTSSFFRSVFRLHNETLNIWSHLLGFGYFFLLMCALLASPLPAAVASRMDLMPLVVQLVSYQVN